MVSFSKPALRRAWLAAIALILAPELTANEPPAQTSAPVPAFPEPALSITRDELMHHIRYLADDDLEGRASGEKSAAIAAKYVALEFEKYSLQPAGENRTWFQEFEIALGYRIGPDSKLVSRVKSEERTHGVTRDFLPFDNVEKHSASGSVVFAGYGITAPEYQYDDYADLDMRDRIVLLLRREPQANDPQSVFRGTNHTTHAEFRTKLRLAQERGAKAVLIVDAASDRLAIRQMAVGGPFRFGRQTNSIPMLFVEYDVAAGWLRAAHRDLGELVGQIDADLKPRSFLIDDLFVEVTIELFATRAQARNVLGFLPGADPQLKDQVVVLGAHFDHVGYGFPAGTSRTPARIHNGADDNASGTAALLELAEAFARGPAPPRRSMLFIGFDAEERGLLGSRHYVEHPVRALSNTVAMVNFDQVGRGKNGLNIGGIGTSQSFKSMVDELSKPFPLTVTTSAGGRGPSDHSSFYNRGIPVLFFHTGLHPEYHKPSDEWPLIHAPEIELVTRLAWFCADRLANGEASPQFTKSDGIPFRPGARGPQLGIQIDPNHEGDGVKVSEVMAGMPAESSGVKPQDVILQVNGQVLSNRRGLFASLARLKPGEIVELVVLRENQRHNLKLSLSRTPGSP